MPDFGRLRVISNFDRGELQISEWRCLPLIVSAPDWADDEPALHEAIAYALCYAA